MQLFKLMSLLPLLLLLLLLPATTHCGRHEKRLLHWLFNKTRPMRHNPIERPVANDSGILYVWFKVSLQQIIDVDEKNQILFSNIWLDLTWEDYHFKWNPKDFGNIQKINIDPHRVWKPDILLYNSADEKFDGTFPTNVVIEHTGSVSYIPPGMFKSTCKIDITWFPFDSQRCLLKFGSWTYDGGSLDLRFKCTNTSLDTIEKRLNDPMKCSEEGSGDTSTYIESGEWNLEGLPGRRYSIKYDCCPHPYIDLKFYLKIRRRKLYYIFNLIGPCSFMSCLSLLSFIIPPDAGEKVSFGVTILLSLTVFLMMVAEAMPPTSDAVPVIGMYFASTMIMCSLSVAFTVIVLNYHHRDAESHPIPNWIRKLICTYLASILRMERQHRSGRQPQQQQQQRQRQQQRMQQQQQQNVLRMRRKRRTGSGSVGGAGIAGVPFGSGDFVGNDTSIAEMQERSSKSLLANVLDLDDDIRSTSASASASAGGVAGHAGSGMCAPPNYTSCVNGCFGVQQQQQQQQPKYLHQCSSRNDLEAVLAELRVVTKRISDEMTDSEVASEWKFAARVIDRLCLILFTCCTIIATCAILFSAPNVFSS